MLTAGSQIESDCLCSGTVSRSIFKAALTLPDGVTAVSL